MALSFSSRGSCDVRKRKEETTEKIMRRENERSDAWRRVSSKEPVGTGRFSLGLSTS